MGMEFASNGAAELGNYSVSAPAATAVVAMQVPLLPTASRIVVALDSEYRLTYSSPGVHYQNAGGADGDISFSMHEVHAGGQVGLRLANKTFTVAARAGYHYSTFVVDDVDNPGRMPREHLQGLRLGGRAHFAPQSSAFVLRGGFDMLANGSRNQTPGLEDGTESTAGAWWAFAGFDYPVTEHINMSARYSYERATTDWTGQSTRQPDVSEASRSDQSHLLYAGITRSF